MSQPFGSPPSFYFDQDQQPRKKAGCLTAWSIFGIVAGSLLLLVALAGRRTSLDPINVIPGLNIGLGVAAIVGYIGVLLWKKWGYYLVLSLYILTTVLRIGIVLVFPALLGGTGIFAIVAGIIGGCIFFALARGVLQYMS
jgi:hypothetical protein